MIGVKSEFVLLYFRWLPISSEQVANKIKIKNISKNTKIKYVAAKEGVKQPERGSFI